MSYVTVSAHLMLRWLLWWRPPCLLRSVIVNLQTSPETALRGVLWQSRGAWLVLREVQVLKANAPSTAVDGEVVIHRAMVTFIQVLP